MSSICRFVCYNFLTTLLIFLISESNGETLNRVGAQGIRGETGAKGEKGQKGEKGEVGPFARTADAVGAGNPIDDEGERSERALRGSQTNPATACQDEELDSSRIEPGKPIYIFSAKPFEVTCTVPEPVDDPSDSEMDEGGEGDYKTCLFKKTKQVVNGHEFSEKPFWLSTKGFDLYQFYRYFGIVHISQLKYLLKISYRVSLEIIVHCKNTEISKDSGKYLQIHLWDGQNIGPFPTTQSPIYYEIPDEYNKCKDFTDKTKWETATIKFNASSNFIKDFYIRDIKLGNKQEVDIELKEFCVYY